MNSPFAILVRLLLGCILNAVALCTLVLWFMGHGGLTLPVVLGLVGVSVLPAIDDVDNVLDAMRKASEP